MKPRMSVARCCCPRPGTPPPTPGPETSSMGCYGIDTGSGEFYNWVTLGPLGTSVPVIGRQFEPSGFTNIRWDLQGMLYWSGNQNPVPFDNGATITSAIVEHWFVPEDGVGLPDNGASYRTAVLDREKHTANPLAPDSTVNWKFFAELSTNAGPPLTDAGDSPAQDIFDRTRTNTSVDFARAHNAITTRQILSFDITTVIQELVDQPGWTSNSPLMLLMDLDSPNDDGYGEFWSWKSTVLDPPEFRTRISVSGNQ